MAGGLMNLVSEGQQNIILNGNPSKTFWKGVYQKYTNFGKQNFRLDFEGTPQQPYLRIAGSDTLITMLIIGHISWNIADAALFLDYDRQPNVYDPSLYVLLNFLKV